MIHAYYESYLRGWCQVDSLGIICDILSEECCEDDIKIFRSDEVMPLGEGGKGHRFAAANLSLENPENGKYFLVSYMDLIVDIERYKCYNLDNIVEIFATTGMHMDLEFFTPYIPPPNITVTPFTAVCGNKIVEQAISDLYGKINVERIVHEKPTFVGNIMYGLRHYLTGDKRFNVHGNKIGYYEYAENLFRQKICFGLNGGEISTSDVEVMGSGSALFRPEFRTTKTHNPLIPNYHYISVKHDDLQMRHGGEYVYFKELSDRIIDRYEEVKKDDDLIEFVGKNGRKWYEENGTSEAAAKILLKLIDFDKLC